MALLLADLDGAVNGAWGAAVIDGPLLHLSCDPGGTAHPRTVLDAEGLVAEFADLAGSPTPATRALHLDLDLDAPLGAVPDRPEPLGHVVQTLDPALADMDIVAVVGPGVVRARALSELHEFAAVSGIPVFNTWDAKGVFRWDSPFHGGTVGVQSDDLTLAGVFDAELVVTSGLDPAGAVAAAVQGLVTLDVPPSQLAALVHRWTPTAAPTDRSRLYRDLAAVVTPLYESDTSPVNPARAALHLSGAAPDDGVVTGDAGTAGHWLARTFPTGIPGSIVLPPRAIPGCAVAGAFVAELAGRRAIAVIDDGPDDATNAVIELAAADGVELAVQAWSDEHPPTGPDDHVTLCRDGFTGAARGIRPVGTDGSGMSRLVDVAGPVVAWQDSPK